MKRACDESGRLAVWQSRRAEGREQRSAAQAALLVKERRSRVLSRDAEDVCWGGDAGDTGMLGRDREIGPCERLDKAGTLKRAEIGKAKWCSI